MHTWVSVLTCAAVLSVSVSAEPRVALVIGNGAYAPSTFFGQKTDPSARIDSLPNPANDARAIAELLRKTGFDVDVRTDIMRREMYRAIDRFGERLRSAGPGTTALFFYGGHGLQADGENFLVPIGATIEIDSDIPREDIAASDILKQMENAGSKVSIVILDACRNTPVLSHNRSAGVSRGLAPVRAPTGSYVAYSTAPGEIANDGVGGHSPFAAALLAHIMVPEPIEDVFTDVRLDVLKATGNKQTPWSNSSLTQKFYFVSPPTKSGSTPIDPKQIEIAYWISIGPNGTKKAYQQYLKRYPQGDFVDQAREKVETIEEHETENALWNRTNAAGTIAAYQAYLTKYPDGEYTIAAYDKIKALEPAASSQTDSARAEETFWGGIYPNGNKKAFQDYLSEYPQGGHVAVARDKIADFERREADATFWNESNATGTEAAYQQYLEKYPQGSFTALAREKIAAFENREREVAFWDASNARGTKKAYQDYLAKYPQGEFSVSARRKLAELTTQQSRPLPLGLADTMAKKLEVSVRGEVEDASEKARDAANRARADAQRANGSSDKWGGTNAVASVMSFTAAGARRMPGYGVLSGKDNVAGWRYSGQVANGLPNGFGIMTWDNGTTYEGEFRANRREGYGIENIANGDCYEGAFATDRKAGAGLYRFKNGSVWLGHWNGNKLNGTALKLNYQKQVVELGDYEEGTPKVASTQ